MVFVIHRVSKWSPVKVCIQAMKCDGQVQYQSILNQPVSQPLFPVFQCRAHLRGVFEGLRL